ncbi:hypothetical protein Pssp01_05590 [Pseudomonas sp. NBRC 100443]|nr:hypothetical protein Pssp01_05590 [Pseudomonas sp. NBRC 100443]
MRATRSGSYPRIVPEFPVIADRVRSYENIRNPCGMGVAAYNREQLYAVGPDTVATTNL